MSHDHLHRHKYKTVEREAKPEPRELPTAEQEAARRKEAERFYRERGQRMREEGR